MAESSFSKRYQAWYASPAGSFAMARCRDMLRSLLSGWPRRSRSVLVLNAGSGAFLETLWEAGFDVTGQDSEPEFLDQAKLALGKRAEYVLSVPEHLPFDDGHFDYAVAVAALEFWKDPEAVLREMERLACCGVILIFPNAWSLFGLECRLHAKSPLCSTALPLLRTPYSILTLSRDVFGKKKTAWASVLPAVTATWKPRGVWRVLNAFQCPVPLGAFTGLRIDFGPLYTGTPLLLRNASPVVSAE